VVQVARLDQLLDVVGHVGAEIYDKHSRTIQPIGGISEDDFGRLNQSLTRLERFWTDQIRYRLVRECLS
jgi:hypothetical protein